jgi:RNA polymerase sigma factor (sigma-70 family)
MTKLDEAVDRFVHASRDDREKALEDALQPLQALLIPHIRDLLHDPADTSDVLQETLILLVRNREALRSPSSLKSFARRIATNVSLNFNRTRARRPKANFPLEDLDEALASGLSLQEPPVDTATEEAIIEMKEALQTLSAGDRRLLNEFMEGRTPLEISNKLGMTVASVAASISRAKQNLRNAVNKLKGNV